MNYLRTDLYTRVNHECPVSVDLHKVDNLVEIALGEHRFGSDTLRLLVDHPDTCDRVAAALIDARNKLTTHLHSEANSDSAKSQLDTQLTNPLAS